MHSIEKGNKLEDEFYEYLLGQQRRGELIFDVYPPQNCQIFKKKKYYDHARKGPVEFDIVVELSRPERTEPHLRVVFECKNYKGSIREPSVTHFSNTLTRMFGHGAKGVFVISSRLQSGAENFAKSCGIGIVKYDQRGFETVADRKTSYREKSLVAAQIFESTESAKSLKFSAYYNNNYFGSVGHFLQALDGRKNATFDRSPNVIPYIGVEHVKDSVRDLLGKVSYVGGQVDLSRICSELFIALTFSEETVHDAEGRIILGSANFDQRSIEIYSHSNPNRARFTLGHEIGHFCLWHDRYLRSESVVANDLFVDSDDEVRFNYDRLEFQANTFASSLILPDEYFKMEVARCRIALGIRDRGHGYIYVDDQPVNLATYMQLLSRLSSYFGASKTAVEIRLKNLEMLTDQRRLGKSPFSQVLAGVRSVPWL